VSCGPFVRGVCDAGVLRQFTDSAGRRLTLPDHIDRAMAADLSAEVLVFVLAPDKLVGWVQPPSGALPALAKHLPMIGPIADPGATAAITRLKPDVIIDVGDVTPDRAAFADQVTQATGTP
jgi:iron complex transport system substrate-binding protein